MCMRTPVQGTKAVPHVAVPSVRNAPAARPPPGESGRSLGPPTCHLPQASCGDCPQSHDGSLHPGGCQEVAPHARIPVLSHGGHAWRRGGVQYFGEAGVVVWRIQALARHSSGAILT